MGYQRAHHKKKGKCEKSQISHIKPYFRVKGKPMSDQDFNKLFLMVFNEEK
jgi:hypothetical protein